jgi:hypothetical protein
MEIVPLKLRDYSQEEIPFFHDFAEKYSAEMPEVNCVFCYSETSQSSDPFAINGRSLSFNQLIWNRIGLTTEELEAMLAHEIGHAVDKLPRTDDNQPERENNADDFAISHFFGDSLCSALKKCILSGIYSDQEVEGMKMRISRIHFNNLNQRCDLLRGIHSEPKNKWLIAVNDHWDEILNTPLNAERIRILENLASQIIGIGHTTIEETLTWFDA